jgi:hypothetical protein
LLTLLLLAADSAAAPSDPVPAAAVAAAAAVVMTIYSFLGFTNLELLSISVYHLPMKLCMLIAIRQDSWSVLTECNLAVQNENYQFFEF